MTDQPSNKLLIAEPPLQVLPSLAVRLGLPEAIFVQQLHYMLINPKLGKVMDGAKWIRNSLQEWHEIFPFWAVNTIRDILERLVTGKVLRFCVPSGRCTWYTLDYETLGTANLKPEKTKKADDPNFGQSMKKYRKSKNDLETGQSMIQKLDASKTTAKTSSENSEEGVPSSEFARTASGDARTSLEDEMKRLREHLQHGRVFEVQYDPAVVERLIGYGEIERCMTGERVALCLKGKCDVKHETGDTPAPHDAALDALHDVIAPLAETPAPPPTPAALPEVPSMLMLTPGVFVWWIPATNQRNWCGTQPRVAGVVLRKTIHRVHIMTESNGIPAVKPENLRFRESPGELREWEMTALRILEPLPSVKAAARKVTAAGKAAKPKLVQPSKEIKDCLATLIYGGVDLVNGSWKLIVKLWNDLECPTLDKVLKYAAWWPQNWPGNTGQKPQIGNVKSTWDKAMHDKTVLKPQPAIDYTDDGEEF